MTSLPHQGSSLFGPVISTSPAGWDRHQRLFGAGLHMTTYGQVELDGPAVRQILGVPAERALISTCLTPGTRSGVLLIALDPPDEATVRRRDEPTARDALKVIDFYAPSFEAAVRRLAQAGFDIEPDVASYNLEAGTFREAHVWAEDAVIVALLAGPAGFFEDFARVRDRVVSEVQSLSAPVTDLEPVLAFYADVLGFEPVFRYEVTDPSFADLVGTDERLAIDAVNVGVSTADPYLGLIDYGPVAGRGVSLADRSRLPRRGVVGCLVEVADLDGARARARAGGHETSEAHELDLPGIGACTLARITAPHGVEHLVMQPGR